MGEFRVFVVDDDATSRLLLAGLLEDDCAVEVFPSGATCLDRVRSVRPDMFLLDVKMPAMDGHELCRRLKAGSETQAIPVTFVSARDSIEERLAAYEAGGDDYIVKPFEPQELRNKVRVAERIIEEKRLLGERAGFAQRTALSAMAGMSELGVVIHFLSHSFTCAGLRQIGNALLDALQHYDLQGAVQLRLGGEILSLGTGGPNLPLEASILKHVSTAGRVFQFKSRCVFNYGRITLMVHNMPESASERAGRLRDNISILAEGADARLQAIELERQNSCREQGVLRALPKVHGALEAVQANYRRNCFQLTQLMIGYEEALAKSFVSLGLTEAQEEFLTGMARDYMQKMVAAQDQSLGIVRSLEGVARTLEELVGREAKAAG
mgnify:CR=1 FL=1